MKEWRNEGAIRVIALLRQFMNCLYVLGIRVVWQKQKANRAVRLYSKT